MAQIEGTNGPYTAGVATGKGKLWESRYVKLRQYEEYISDYVDRYWFPPAQPRGQLLPGVSRGSRIDEFPVTPLIAAIELDPALYVQGWFVGELSLADLQLREDPAIARTVDQLALAGYAPADNQKPVWRGWQERDGSFHDTETALVRRGYGSEVPLCDLLSHRPPSIYYSDGKTSSAQPSTRQLLYVASCPGESFTTCAFRAPSRRAPRRCRGAAGSGVAAFLHSPSNPRILRAEQRSIRGASSQAGPARPPLC